MRKSRENRGWRRSNPFEIDIIKKLLTQTYQYYQVNYIQDNKEVTELWAYNSIDMFIQIKAYALRGLSKEVNFFFFNHNSYQN